MIQTSALPAIPGPRDGSAEPQGPVAPVPPRLTKAVIRNFRLLRRTELSFTDEVTLCVGRNNTGNLFQIHEMLANFSRRDELVDKELEAFIRARNLFYVACSRAREHLAILFTTKLEPASLDTLREWVGESRITSLWFDGDTVVGGE